MTEAAKERLRTVLPHLRIAANMARLEVPDGKIQLGIIASNSTEGRITARFEIESFLNDLEAVVGADQVTVTELLDGKGDDNDRTA